MNDLQMIFGGSGIHNGDDPVAHTIIPPVADSLTTAPFDPYIGDNKNIKGK